MHPTRWLIYAQTITTTSLGAIDMRTGERRLACEQINECRTQPSSWRRVDGVEVMILAVAETRRLIYTQQLAARAWVGAASSARARAHLAAAILRLNSSPLRWRKLQSMRSGDFTSLKQSLLHC
jgi:hypothetical protein